MGFQVFNIFFTFKFWKPDIEACSIGFPVIGNKICFFGAPVRNKIVFALISKNVVKWLVLFQSWPVIIGEDEATWKWQSFALSNKTQENYFCLLQFQNNYICILSFLYYKQ